MIQKKYFSLLCCVCIFLLLISSIASASNGTVTVNYNNGGSIKVMSQVRMENNIIYVENDNPVEIQIIPNEGYKIMEIYQNDVPMEISGTETKNVSVNPNGTDLKLRITFVKADMPTPPTSNITNTEQSKSETNEIIPPKDNDSPTSSSSSNKTQQNSLNVTKTEKNPENNVKNESNSTPKPTKPETSSESKNKPIQEIQKEEQTNTQDQTNTSSEELILPNEDELKQEQLPVHTDKPSSSNLGAIKVSDNQEAGIGGLDDIKHTWLSWNEIKIILAIFIAIVLSVWVMMKIYQKRSK